MSSRQTEMKAWTQPQGSRLAERLRAVADGPGGGPLNPSELVSSSGADLVSNWLWDLSLPLVPGANDIPDHTGPNPGSTFGGIDAADVVDSPYPWLPPVVARPFSYNRARKVADGARTAWVSPSPTVDSAMAYHPDALNPADYDDFVATGVDRA